MISKKTQAMHVKKGDDKIVITQATRVPLWAPWLVTKGNLKQRVGHFVETCSQVGIECDLLVKQFVQSLQGNAFDWYIDLTPKCIDN